MHIPPQMSGFPALSNQAVDNLLVTKREKNSENKDEIFIF